MHVWQHRQRRVGAHGFGPGRIRQWAFGLVLARLRENELEVADGRFRCKAFKLVTLEGDAAHGRAEHLYPGDLNTARRPTFAGGWFGSFGAGRHGRLSCV